MGESRVGVAKNFKGRGQEGVGRAAGGRMKQAEGLAFKPFTVKPWMAPAKPSRAVRKMPGSVEDAMREYILARPFATAAITLGLGWLLDRAHRPF
jgi:hypothetical protein